MKEQGGTLLCTSFFRMHIFPPEKKRVIKTQKINVICISFQFQEVNKPHKSQKKTKNYKIQLNPPKVI